MAPKSMFLLKDSPPEVIAASNTKPKGRSYSTEYSHQPCGIKAEELMLGMKLASLAITDDKPDTLKNVSMTNPWQEQALTMIAGSKEEAHKPLSEILKKNFNLTVDAHIDISGVSRGRAVDTQGYIAHNDEIIVLSYRCTTSILDWITNFSTTSSEWEPEEDVAAGHAGWCSCLEGGWCGGNKKDAKPRVHTGFYNNFLHTTTHISYHILPLLKEDQPPRTLYVVGHSLGAGIATLAAIFLLQKCEWELLPHKLVCVTAGSPRSVQQPLQEIVEARLKVLRPLDKATFCRVVLNEDVVATVPPTFLGYVHVGKLVYITEEGEVLINPSHEHTVDENAVKKLISSDPYAGVKQARDQAEQEQPEDASDELTKEDEKYEKMLKLVPGPLKDHMPDFYLKPLVTLFEKEKNGEL